MSIHSRADVIAACLKTMRESPDQLSAGYIAANYGLLHAMTSSHRESLGQLVRNGPVWDGDVISKRHRDDLIDWGLASRVIFKGEQGYTAANYRGWDVLMAEPEK